jgi:hypothetical protein
MQAVELDMASVRVHSRVTGRKEGEMINHDPANPAPCMGVNGVWAFRARSRNAGG